MNQGEPTCDINQLQYVRENFYEYIKDNFDKKFVSTVDLVPFVTQCENDKLFDIFNLIQLLNKINAKVTKKNENDYIFECIEPRKKFICTNINNSILKINKGNINIIRKQKSNILKVSVIISELSKCNCISSLGSVATATKFQKKCYISHLHKSFLENNTDGLAEININEKMSGQCKENDALKLNAICTDHNNWVYSPFHPARCKSFEKQSCSKSSISKKFDLTKVAEKVYYFGDKLLLSCIEKSSLEKKIRLYSLMCLSNGQWLYDDTLSPIVPTHDQDPCT